MSGGGKNFKITMPCSSYVQAAEEEHNKNLLKQNNLTTGQRTNGKLHDVAQDPYVTLQYTGFIPDTKTRFGKSCARISSIIINKMSAEQPDSIRLFPDLNDYSKSIDLPSSEDIDYLKRKTNKGVPLPKYQGYISGSQNYVGERVPVIQAKCLVKLKKDIEEYNKQALKFQEGVGQNTVKVSKDKEINNTHSKEHQYKGPFMGKRIEDNSSKQLKLEENSFNKYLLDPYFSEPTDPNKYFIKDYQGYKPFYKTYFGMPNRIAQQHGLVEFYNNYTKNIKSETPTTTQASLVDTSYCAPLPPNGNQLFPPQYPDTYNSTNEIPLTKDPIGEKEMQKMQFLTGYNNCSSF